MSLLEPILWQNDHLLLLDQRLLPSEEILNPIRSLEDCHDAIRDMVVRGAPCIGFTAIFGMALWLKTHQERNLNALTKAAAYLKAARPTAVNLLFETDRAVTKIIECWENGENAYERVIALGNQEMELAYQRNLKMAQAGLKALEKSVGNKKYRIQTHCNTGALACGQLGTALGVIFHLHENNLIEKVWVDETRPYMQGSRLTAYELERRGIPFEIVVEGSASYLMTHKLVDAIFVGADRIAKNGDTANKIGTATLATVAFHHKVPFYVAAPLSTFDSLIANGSEIPIELRDPEEILKYKNIPIAPTKARALNPSFDVTDHSLITALLCEQGIIYPPFTDGIAHVWQGHKK